MKNISLIVFGLLLSGCGEQNYNIQQGRKGAENEVKTNFNRQRWAFLSLEYYFKFNHIKEVRFTEKAIFIKYVKDLHRNEGVQEMQANEIVSAKMTAILALDSVGNDDILRLRKYLFFIKSDKMQIIESYDEKTGSTVKFF